MAKRIKPLSDRRVATLKARGRYHDPEHRGLYLQVDDNSNKSWLLRYQIDNRERWMGLGSYKDFSLKEARKRARQRRQLVADGIDPIEHKITTKDAAVKKARERQTFKEATLEFLNLHGPSWKNQKHRKQWESTLTDYAFPKLGDRSVSAIDTAMVNEAIMPIWNKTPETARRTRDRIQRVIQWVKEGKPLPNANGNGKKHHAALPWQEMPAFMVELRQRESLSARALQFTILTAARTNDTIGATWDEIDLESKVWTIPAERMKASREHRVPLSAPLIELLSALPRERGNQYLFIGARKGEGLSNMAMLELLRGLRSGVTVHGFRSSFKDWASEVTNTPDTVSEMALAHTVRNKVEAAYRRGDLLQKRRKLMDDWSRFCNSTPAVIAKLSEKRKFG